MAQESRKQASPSPMVALALTRPHAFIAAMLTAAAIDPATPTMQVEIALPDRDGALLPGAYVQVALPLVST